MHKKSQLYIVTVLILSVFVFALSSKIAKTIEPTGNFKPLTENYMVEAGRVINSAIYNDNNITQDLNSFTDKFITHANTKNIKLSLLYLLVRENKITTYNKMESPFTIVTQTGNTTLTVGNTTVINQSSLIDNQLRIVVGSQMYPFSMTEGITELKALFRSQNGNETEIIVYD